MAERQSEIMLKQAESTPSEDQLRVILAQTPEEEAYSRRADQSMGILDIPNFWKR